MIVKSLMWKAECDLKKPITSKALKPVILFFLDNRSFLSLLINIILFSLFFFLFTPRFAINDDPAMMRIASGELLGEPNEHLIFINVIIGHFLKFMYEILPQLNWYVLFFYICHFISMVVVLGVFLRNKISFYNILLYLLLFVLVEVHFLTNLQFTTTAFVVGTSGFLLLFSIEDKLLIDKWPGLSMGIILLLLSSLIRENVFYALLLLWVPLISYRVYINKAYQRIIPVAIAVTLVFLANYYDSNHYNKQPDWEYYSQYNSLRANLTDYPQFAYNENTKDVYEHVEWSENNVNMFRAWSFADREVFPLKDLEYIVENIDPVYTGPINIFNHIYFILRYLDSRGLWFIILVFTIASITVRKQEKYHLFIALLMLLVVTVYLSYIGRLPPGRVLYPLIYNTCVISIFYLTNYSNNIFEKYSVRKSLKYFIHIILSVIIVAIFFVEGRNSMINKYVQERIDYNREQLAADRYIYATWPHPGMFYPMIFSEYHTFSFITKNDGYNVKTLPYGGSLSHSPHHNKVYSNHSIENIYIDLAERDDILLIAHPYMVQHNLIEFMEENYGIKVEAVPVSITDDIPAFHISRIETE